MSQCSNVSNLDMDFALEILRRWRTRPLRSSGVLPQQAFSRWLMRRCMRCHHQNSACQVDCDFHQTSSNIIKCRWTWPCLKKRLLSRWRFVASGPSVVSLLHCVDSIWTMRVWERVPLVTCSKGEELVQEVWETRKIVSVSDDLQIMQHSRNGSKRKGCQDIRRDGHSLALTARIWNAKTQDQEKFQHQNIGILNLSGSFWYHAVLLYYHVVSVIAKVCAGEAPLWRFASKPSGAGCLWRTKQLSS